jgi:hypothetical protein
MDIAFAFGGQINWMRYITTMKQRSKFAAAASLTTGELDHAANPAECGTGQRSTSGGCVQLFVLAQELLEVVLLFNHIASQYTPLLLLSPILLTTVPLHHHHEAAQQVCSSSLTHHR